MSTFTEQQIEERYGRLPPELREAIFSPESAKIMMQTGRKFGLTIEQIGFMAEETSFVLLGLTRPADFANQLASRLKLDADKTRALASDINHELFFGLREILKKTHAFDVGPDVFQKPDVLSGIIPPKPPAPSFATPPGDKSKSVAPSVQPPSTKPPAPRINIFPSSTTVAKPSTPTPSSLPGLAHPIPPAPPAPQKTQPSIYSAPVTSPEPKPGMIMPEKMPTPPPRPVGPPPMAPSKTESPPGAKPIPILKPRLEQFTPPERKQEQTPEQKLDTDGKSSSGDTLPSIPTGFGPPKPPPKDSIIGEPSRRQDINADIKPPKPPIISFTPLQKADSGKTALPPYPSTPPKPPPAVSQEPRSTNTPGEKAELPPTASLAPKPPPPPGEQPSAYRAKDPYRELLDDS